MDDGAKLVAVVPGIIMGVGAVLAFLANMRSFDVADSFRRGSKCLAVGSVLICCVPGLVMLWFVTNRKHRQGLTS